jgi:two-component system phosphate regulon response regulator PhoB
VRAERSRHVTRQQPHRRGLRAEPQQRALAQPPVSQPVDSLRILLVDDDASLRSLYRFNLEVSGMSVVEAADGETALKLLRDALPDVVLLDVMMPGIDGWEVAERIAVDPRTAKLPIIFITALADDEARARGSKSGAVGYLAKPFNPVRLADDVAALLAAAKRDDAPPQ